VLSCKEGGAHVTLLLLDSDCDGNAPEDRALTARLYGGDLRTRIRQELVLGVGGVRALRALGIAPGVLHLNEGHSAFAALETARAAMASDGVHFEEACWRVAQTVCFTTHTPVPAGHDRLPAELVEEHLGPLRDGLGISVQDVRDADDLYRTLEDQVIPLYYDLDASGLPRAWIARMRRSIRTLGWRFNADRMVMDYVTHGYLPAAGGLSCRMDR
jgi:glucan phosphorylase